MEKNSIKIKQSKDPRDTQAFENPLKDLEAILKGKRITDIQMSGDLKITLTLENEDGEVCDTEIEAALDYENSEPYLRTCATFYSLDTVYKYISDRE